LRTPRSSGRDPGPVTPMRSTGQRRRPPRAPHSRASGFVRWLKAELRRASRNPRESGIFCWISITRYTPLIDGSPVSELIRATTLDEPAPVRAPQLSRSWCSAASPSIPATRTEASAAPCCAMRSCEGCRFYGAEGDTGRTSGVHTSRSGSRRSGSPWMTKVSPPTARWSSGRGLATSLARSSRGAISA
jgi:hypothetical protein